jgi:cytochrome c-type biogenesis protein CcmH
MMGWLIFLVVALLILLAVWRFAKLPKGASQLIFAALLLAASGYAWHGRPDLPAANAHALPNLFTQSVDMEMRSTMLGNSLSVQPLAIIDTQIRQGRADFAAENALLQVKQRPEDDIAWFGLANALVAKAQGQSTPAALFAYDRATALNPQAPAPRYFKGLLLARMGDFPQTEKIWGEIYLNAPANAAWKPLLAARLMVLKQIIDYQARNAAAQP